MTNHDKQARPTHNPYSRGPLVPTTCTCAEYFQVLTGDLCDVCQPIEVGRAFPAPKGPNPYRIGEDGQTIEPHPERHKATQDKAHNHAPKRVAVARALFEDHGTVPSLRNGLPLHGTMDSYNAQTGPGPLEGWLDHAYQVALVQARWLGGSPCREDYPRAYPAAAHTSKLC